MTTNMLGFIVFVLIVLGVLLFNTPGIYNRSSASCTRTKRSTGLMSNEDFDSITKKNTNINSTTATTSTKMQHLLSGKSTDIIDGKFLRSKRALHKPSNNGSKRKKLRFSNNVNVRLFDIKTREVLGDGKKRL